MRLYAQDKIRLAVMTFQTLGAAGITPALDALAALTGRDRDIFIQSSG